MDEPHLLQRARDTLAANWTGRSTVPSHTLYPHQWSWDAAFMAVGWAHVDGARAAAELETLLRGQWADGRVPHIVFDDAVPADAYFPGPDFWRSHEAAQAPAGVGTSGIVQPPLHARAALEIHRHAADPAAARAFLVRVYPRLAAQHHYLAAHRDAGGAGLAAIVHPWESGLDDSPAWDEALRAVPVPAGGLGDYVRRDLAHVDAAQRPTNGAYDRFVLLARHYRDGGYRDRPHAASAHFLVEDPLFNAIYLWSTHALAAIATLVGADPRPHEAAAARIHDGLLARLWDPARARFAARDLLADRLIDRRVVGGLVPLLDPDLPRPVVDAVLAALDSPHFDLGPEGGGVPTYDLLAADFDPRRYWRGPVWVNTNWLVARGLRAHGEDARAQRLEAATVALVAQGGLREYFDPRTGEGYGSRDFGWTAALLIDLLAGGRATPVQPLPH
jgi:hypothetical protein